MWAAVVVVAGSGAGSWTAPHLMRVRWVTVSVRWGDRRCTACTCGRGGRVCRVCVCGGADGQLGQDEGREGGFERVYNFDMLSCTRRVSCWWRDRDPSFATCTNNTFALSTLLWAWCGCSLFGHASLGQVLLSSRCHTLLPSHTLQSETCLALPVKNQVYKSVSSRDHNRSPVTTAFTR